jgi:uncharacterized protein (TIRG00374 family)
LHPPADAKELPSRPRWASWITYASVPIAVVAMGWTIYRVGLAALLHRLFSLGPWLFVVIGIEVLVTACDAGAIYFFAGKDCRHLRYRHVLMAQVAGRAINVITPFGSIGELVKVALLVERAPQARAIAAVLLYDIAGHEISFALVALGAPLTALLMGVPPGMRFLLLVAGGVGALIAVAIPWLLHRGLLGTLAAIARKLHLFRRHIERWREKLVAVDDRLRDGGHERTHERYRGFACMVASRALTWLLIGLLVYAAGGPTSIGFLAAVFTAGQVITWIANLVPLGIGVAESGNYALFYILGANPAVGVTVALARRVTYILYAAIGLVLFSLSRTVKRLSGRTLRRHAGTDRSSPALPR